MDEYGSKFILRYLWKFSYRFEPVMFQIFECRHLTRGTYGFTFKVKRYNCFRDFMSKGNETEKGEQKREKNREGERRGEKRVERRV